MKSFLKCIKEIYLNITKEKEMTNFTFTRYLYEKQEVGYSLLHALLQKKEEEAMFWATELYESGFEEELYEFLWNIFQDFYASLNLKFEHYLLKKIAILKEKNKGGNIIIHLHLIIKNLIIRPYNLDSFSLTTLINNFEIESTMEGLEQQQESPNYLQIAVLIFDQWNKKDQEFLEKKLESFIEFFKHNTNVKETQTKNIIKDWHTTIKLLKSVQLSFSFSPQKLFITRILHLYSLSTHLKMGKIVTLTIPEEEIEQEIDRYKPNLNLHPYQIFKNERRYKINGKIGALSTLKRNQISNIDIKTAYLEDWLYYASFSPIWKERIENYNGFIVEEERKVFFEDEEHEELFYMNYDYKPDEQSSECHEKSIGDLENITLKEWFQEEYKKSSNHLYKIEDKYLNEL